MTMTLVNTTTLATTTASIEFTSIPQTATDLLLIFSLRGAFAGGVDQATTRLTINSTSTNYSGKLLSGDGSTVSSTNDNASYISVSWLGGTSSIAFSNCSVYIPNYASASNKSISFDGTNEANGTVGLQRIGAGLWSNTAAITSLKLDSASGSLAQYSTASLYTITKGSGGATVS